MAKEKDEPNTMPDGVAPLRRWPRNGRVLELLADEWSGVWRRGCRSFGDNFRFLDDAGKFGDPEIVDQEAPARLAPELVYVLDGLNPDGSRR